jgi:hypothetical protein
MVKEAIADAMVYAKNVTTIYNTNSVPCFIRNRLGSFSLQKCSEKSASEGRRVPKEGGVRKGLFGGYRVEKLGFDVRTQYVRETWEKSLSSMSLEDRVPRTFLGKGGRNQKCPIRLGVVQHKKR